MAVEPRTYSVSTTPDAALSARKAGGIHTLDEDADRNNNIDGAREGEEARSQRELEGTRHLGFDQVLIGHTALLEGRLDAVNEVGAHLVVPPCPDDSDVHIAAVQLREVNRVVAGRHNDARSAAAQRRRRTRSRKQQGGGENDC